MKRKMATKAKQTLTRTQRMLAELNKEHGAGTFVHARHARANIRGSVDSGIPLLNVLLSGYVSRGWSLGRIYELYGEPDVGKSTLLCMAIAQCQKQLDGLGCYIDTEGTMTRDRMLALGINEDALLVCEEIWAEAVLQQIERVMQKSGRHAAVIVWDTVASTRSKAHDGAELGRGKRAAVATAMSEGLAMLIPTVAKSRTVVIACNQKRSGAIDGGWHSSRDQESTKGGQALKFHANCRVRVEFSSDYWRSIKGVKTHYGFVSRVTASKSKQTASDVPIKLVFQTKGAGRGKFNNALSCLVTMQMWEIVSKRFDSSGRVAFNGEKYTPAVWEKRYNEDKPFRDSVHTAIERHFQTAFMGVPYTGDEEEEV